MKHAIFFDFSLLYITSTITSVQGWQIWNSEFWRQAFLRYQQIEGESDQEQKENRLGKKTMINPILGSIRVVKRDKKEKKNIKMRR